MIQVMVTLPLPQSYSDTYMNQNLLMQLETERGVGNADGGGGTAQVLLLQTGTSCHRCISISEEGASAPASVCITHHQDFPSNHEHFLQTFSTLPKINWNMLPKPAGADGQLSSECYGYRLYDYGIVVVARVFLEEEFSFGVN